MRIILYCDGGGKKVCCYDAHLDKMLFARVGSSAKYVGEYRSILFALKYIESTYKDRDILLLTDGKSEYDILNGNAENHRNPTKEFGLIVKEQLKKVRENNIVNIQWLPRNRNEAGIFLQKTYVQKQKVIARSHNFVQVTFQNNEITPFVSH